MSIRPIIRFFFKFVTYCLAVVGLLFILSIVSIISTLNNYLPEFEDSPKIVKPNTVLQLDIGDQPLNEGPGNFSIQSLFAPNLQDIIMSIYEAAKDPLIKGLIINIKGEDISLPHVQEIHDALTIFKQAGKFVYAYAQTFGELSNGTTAYCLASIADSISVQPQGRLNLIGYMVETPFYKDFMDEWQVYPHIMTREEYKNAPHPYLYSGLTPSHREHNQYMVDAIFTEAQTIITRNRNIPTVQANHLMNQGPYLDIDAKKHGLVHQVEYHHEMIQRIESQKLAQQPINLMSVRSYKNPTEGATKIPYIAVIHLEGEITSGHYMQEASDGFVIRALQKAVKDPMVKGIIVRINSGGGSSTASDAIYGEMIKASSKKPLVASMSDAAASGGYMVACGAPYIIAQPATLTGSIGVYGGKFTTKHFWEQFGINWETVKQGSHADIYSSDRSYTKEEFDYINLEMDQIYNTFKLKVSQSRKLPLFRVHQLAKGHVWLGRHAKEFGLVDELGGYASAIRYIKKKLNMNQTQDIDMKNYPHIQFLERLAGLLLSTSMNFKNALGFGSKTHQMKRLLIPTIYINNRSLTQKKRQQQDILNVLSSTLVKDYFSF